jgi:hypothetical protein
MHLHVSPTQIYYKNEYKPRQHEVRTYGVTMGWMWIQHEAFLIYGSLRLYRVLSTLISAHVTSPLSALCDMLKQVGKEHSVPQIVFPLFNFLYSLIFFSHYFLPLRYISFSLLFFPISVLITFPSLFYSLLFFLYLFSPFLPLSFLCQLKPNFFLKNQLTL